MTTPIHLSGTPGSGRNIKIAATATPGTTIHTAIAGATQMDEIWLWANNSDTTPRKLTIEFGGVTSPDDTIELTIPAESGEVLVLAGRRLNGGVVLRAFCATTNVVMVGGHVNRINVS